MRNTEKYPFSKEEYENRKRISLQVSNYYGETEVCEINGVFYIILENWDGLDIKEVSKGFYDACKKEFEDMVEEDGE